MHRADRMPLDALQTLVGPNGFAKIATVPSKLF